MNILVVADIHNDIENLMTLIDKISTLDFDLILCVGDVTDYGVPKGFSKVDIGRIILEELKTFNKPILVVPGNMDKDIISLIEEEKVSLHGRGRVIDNVGFYGFGGAKTPFGSPLEPTEEELKVGLERGYDEVKDVDLKVQVTHVPPAGTKVDMLLSGAHVGSELVRTFIEKKKPSVAVSAHIHEARGTDELGETKLINPGRFPEGYCGLITVKTGYVNAKIISLI